MPEYHFTGAYPRVLTGLTQGVNASVRYSRAALPPYGSTIEAYPGDSIRTDAPYEHPELEELVVERSDAHGLSPEDEAWSPAEPVVPIALVAAPETPADPAPADMTAEGAPAPAEPTL